MTEAGGEDTRFPVDVPGYSGSLAGLVAKSQRGEVDVASIPVALITADYRRRLAGPGGRPELSDIADFLTLMARLVALKAAAVLPAHGAEEAEDETDPADEAGRRLAEYRLFKAAADALLAEAANGGAQSFLSLVSPDVIPIERMRIPPERLAAAFRAVLERLAEAEPLPIGAVTFSVEEKMADIRSRLLHGPLDFEQLFSGVETRLEAVACFLALLELLRRGEAAVDQAAPFAPIRVSAGG